MEKMKRLISAILCIVMLITLLPLSALAEEIDNTDNQDVFPAQEQSAGDEVAQDVQPENEDADSQSVPTENEETQDVQSESEETQDVQPESEESSLPEDVEEYPEGDPADEPEAVPEDFLEENGWLFRIVDDYAEVVGYADYSKESLRIPLSLGEYDVRAVADGAFSANSGLRYLHIHSNITEIGSDIVNPAVVKLFGYSGSEALRYAEDKGIPCTNESTTENYELVASVIDFSYAKNTGRYQIIDGNTIRFGLSEAALLKRGRVFFLDEVNGDGLKGISAVVESMSFDETGCTVTVSAAEAEEVYVWIRVHDDNLQADWSQAVWAEGVEITQEKIEYSGSVTGNLATISFKKEFSGNSKVQASFSGKITGGVDIDYSVLKGELNELSVYVKPELAFKGGFYFNMAPDDEYTYNPTKDLQRNKNNNAKHEWKTPIGTVPLVSAGIASINCTIYLEYSISGEIEISIEYSPKIGIEYNKAKGDFQGFKEWSRPKVSLGAEFTGQFGPAVGLELRVVGIGNVISIEAFLGVEGKVSIKMQTIMGSGDGAFCADLSLSAKIIMKFSLGIKSKKLKRFSQGVEFNLVDFTIPIADGHVEPLKTGWLKIVDHCTYGNEVSFCTFSNYKIDPVTVEYAGRVSQPVIDVKKDKNGQKINDIVGWYKDKAFTQEWDFANDTVKEDVTLYAKWKLNARKVTLDYGGITENKEIFAYPGVTIPEQAKPMIMNYRFEGWFTEPEFKHEWVFNNDVMPDNEMTLYGKLTYEEGYDPFSDSALIDPSTPLGNISGGKLYYNGHIYEHVAEYVSYSTALQMAESQGGYLVTIGSDEEMSAVQRYVRDDCAQEALWLGISQATGWNYWLNGEAVTYTNWSSPPSSSSDYYGTMIRTSGKWVPAENSATRHYIIEWGDFEIDPGFAPPDAVNYSQSKTGDGFVVTGRTSTAVDEVIDPTYMGELVTTIGDGVFIGDNTLETIEIPNTLEAIGEEAFKDCKKLKKIVLPDSVVYIGERAFEGCTALEEVVVGSGLKTISARAFADCTSLKSINIDKITTIGNEAFSNCSSLAKVAFSTKLSSVGSNAFKDCTSLTTVSLPNNASVGTGVFYGCSAAKTAQIPESITNIPGSMYYNCSGLQSVYVYGDIKKVNSDAFANVNAMFFGYPGTELEKWCDTNGKMFKNIRNQHSVNFENTNNGLTTPQINTTPGTIKADEIESVLVGVGERVTEPVIMLDGYFLEGWYTDSEYQNKWDFAQDTMPAHNITLYAKWIEDESNFNYKVSNGSTTITGYNRIAETIEIPDTLGGYPVTTIASEAFSYDYDVKRVILPSTLTTIEPDAFTHCKNIFTIDAGKTENFVNVNGVLFTSDMSTLVCVPAGRTLTSYTVPDGVNCIFEGAFSNQNDLSRIVIPDSVTEIQENALPLGMFLTIYGSVDDCAAKSYAEENMIRYNKYMVSFFNGEEELYSVWIEAGEPISDYMQLDEGVMSYDGWYKDAELTEPWDFETDIMPEENISLYIKWEYAFIYEENEDGITVTGYNGGDTDVNIPESINGVTVIAIAEGAFPAECAARSILIPPTVTNIEEGAIGDAIIIGDVGTAAEQYASDNALNFEIREYTVTLNTMGGAEIESITAVPGEKLTLPEPVRSNYHFMGWCRTNYLSSVWTDDNVMPAEDITLYAAWKKVDATENDNFVYEVLPDGTASIVSYTGDKLSLNIPDTINGITVTKIGNSAFEGNKHLVSVTIPSTVTEIGSYAFSNTQIQTVLGGENVKSLGIGCFSNSQSLRPAFIPAGITEIPAYCFYACTALTEVNIPESVTVIGNDAFGYCKFVDEVSIPESVAEIGEDAFCECKMLKEVSVPGTLRGSAEEAFEDTVDISYYDTNTLKLLEVKQVTKASVKLSWNAVKDNSEYYIYRKQGTGGAYQLIKSVSGTSAENFSLTPGVTYSFKVKAKNTGAESQEVSIKLSSLTTPVILGVTQKSEDTAEMTIKSVVGAEGYEVFRAYEPNGEYSLLKTLTGTTTLNTGLMGGRNYYYAVRAYSVIDGVREYSAFSDVYHFNMPLRYISAPEGLYVRETAKNTVYLSWDAVEGAEGYDIYRCRGNGDYSLIKSTNETGSYNYNLAANETYSYKVQAYFYNGADRVCGATSQPASVTIRSVATPQIKSVTQSASGTALVSWTSISAADGYELWRCRTENGKYSLMKEVSGTATSNYNLETGATYFYKVRAFADNNGERDYGDYSLPVSITITDLSMTRIKSVERQNGTDAKIVWAAVTGAESYEVWRSVADNAHYELIRSASGTAVSDKNLADGQTYFYKVRAAKDTENGTIYGEFSQELSVRMIGTPVISLIEQNTADSVNLMWSTVGSADGYEVLVSNQANGTYKVTADISANSTVLYGIEEGSVRYYKVRAYVNTEDGKLTGFESRSKGIQIIGIPEIKSLTQNGANGINISWTAQNGAESYELWRSLSKIGGYEKVKSVNGTSTTSFGLEEGSKYYYKVRACTKLNGATQRSAFSEPLAITVLECPDLTQLEQLSTSSVKLIWTAVKNADSYKIYRSTNIDSGYSPIKTVSETECQDTGLTPETMYYYKVKAVMTENGEKHESAYSLPACIYVTDMEAPEVKASANGDNTAVNVLWNSIKGAEGYEVWREEYPTGNYVLVSDTETVFYSDTAISSGISYNYIVRAYRTVGEDRVYSAFSVQQSAGMVLTGSSGSVNWTQVGSEVTFSGTGTINNNFAGNNTIRRVIISDGITSIASEAFLNCRNLEYVEMSNDVIKINSGAFRGCTNLKTAILSDNLSILGSNAFDGDSMLKEVSLSDNLEIIGTYAFRNCSALEKVELGSGLKKIDSYAFNNCTSLKSVHIPEGVTVIGNYAFANCSALKDIIVPGTVTTVYEYTFSSIGAKTAGPIGGDFDYQYGWTRTMPAYAFSRMSNLTDVRFGNGIRDIGNYACYNCSALKSAVLENSVETVGHYAFRYDAELTQVDFGKSVEAIGDYAFQSCKLESVSLPASLKTIGSYTFGDCYTLKELALSVGLETIGSYAFQNDTALDNVVIPNGTLAINTNAFYNCSALKNVIVPNSVKTIGQNAFYGIASETVGPIGGDYDYQYGWTRTIPAYAFYDMTNLKSAVIGNGVRNLGSYALGYCTALERVVLENSVETIGDNAMRYDSALRSVEFSRNLETIGSYAFHGNTMLNNVMIPEGVTSIGNYAFADCTNLRRLYVPGSVTSIYNNSFSNIGATTVGPVDGGYGYEYGWTRTIPSYAFSNMSRLRTAVIGNNVRTIGSYAFNYCTSLKSVEIGDSVEVIGSYAFYNNTELENVSFGSGLEEIGDFAFRYDSKLSSIVLPDQTAVIGAYAFSDCSNLSSVQFSENLKSIGGRAFMNDQALRSVILPEGTESISDYAFYNCSNLKNVVVPASVKIIGPYVFSEIASETAGPIGGDYDYQYGWTRTIPAYAFSYMTKLKNVTIGDSVRRIDSYAFYYSSVADIVIGDSVESIGDYAFSYMSNLESVKFGTNLETIGNYAFRNDPKLNNVEIPNGTKTIGNYAFYNCTALKELTVPGTVTSIGGEYAFSGIAAETAGPVGGEYDYQYGWTDLIPSYAFSRMSKLTDATIGNRIKTIGSYAFYCSSVENVIFGDSVESIGDYAFYNCTNIADIDFDANLKTIGRNTFQGNTKLNNVELPEGLESIGDYAFYNCSALKKLAIPGTVTSIGGEYAFSGIAAETAGPVGGEYDYQYGWTDSIPAYAFSRMAKLTEVTVGNGVKSIGSYACYFSNVENVVFDDSIESINSYAFYNCTNLADVDFGANLKTIGSYAFQNDTKLNNVELPEGLESIGNYAFYNCTSLKKLTIPGTVTSIGGEYAFFGIAAETAGPVGGEYDYQYGWTDSIPSYAFSRMAKLTEVTVGNGVKSIGSYACYGCNALKKAVIGADVERIGNCAFQCGVKEIVFEGPAVTISSNAFSGINATAYYLIYEQSWTSDVRKNYGGTITWTTYGEIGNIEALRIVEMPLRTNYELGETLSLNGLVLAADYDSGRILLIYPEDITVGAYDFSTAGEKKIALSYDGLTAELTVNVVNVVCVTADPSGYPQSAHNYGNGMNTTWEYSYPEATRLTLNFSKASALENGYDNLYLYDSDGTLIGHYTGDQLSGLTVEVQGNSFSIKMTTDGSVTYYGFSFDSIIAHVPESAPSKM